MADQPTPIVDMRDARAAIAAATADRDRVWQDAIETLRALQPGTVLSVVDVEGGVTRYAVTATREGVVRLDPARGNAPTTRGFGEIIAPAATITVGWHDFDPLTTEPEPPAIRHGAVYGDPQTWNGPAEAEAAGIGLDESHDPDDAVRWDLSFNAALTFSDDLSINDGRGLHVVLSLGGDMLRTVLMIRTVTPDQLRAEARGLTELADRAEDRARARAVRICAADGCPDPEIRSGTEYLYHQRLGVHVHPHCHATRTVRGEDISGHTMIGGIVGGDRG